MADYFTIPRGRIKRFRNRPARCNHCGKRRRGRPSTGYGPCGTHRSPSRKARRAVRSLLREMLRGDTSSFLPPENPPAA